MIISQMAIDIGTAIVLANVVCGILSALVSIPSKVKQRRQVKRLEELLNAYISASKKYQHGQE